MDTQNVNSTGIPGSGQSPEDSGRAIRWLLGLGALFAMGFLGLLLLLFAGLETGVAPLIGGMFLGILPVPLYAALALWLDRYEKEPLWMLGGAFVWGATVAVFFSYIFNTINGVVVSSLFGGAAGEFFTPVISAPVVEESAKGLALLILFLWKRREFDGVLDGIIYAAMVGLGFAMTENFFYYGRAVEEAGVAGGLVVFFVRGILGPFGHPLYTAMTGIGLGLARQSSNTAVKIAAPLIGLAAAMLFHSIWNFSSIPMAMLGMPGLLGLLLAWMLITVPLTLGVLAVVGFSLRREGAIVRRHLGPELAGGAISQAEYQELGSVFGRLKASFGALGRGFGEWRTRSRFHQTASELAFHRDRVERGLTHSEDPEWEASHTRRLRELGRQLQR